MEQEEEEDYTYFYSQYIPRSALLEASAISVYQNRLQGRSDVIENAYLKILRFLENEPEGETTNRRVREYRRNISLNSQLYTHIRDIIFWSKPALCDTEHIVPDVNDGKQRAIWDRSIPCDSDHIVPDVNDGRQHPVIRSSRIQEVPICTAISPPLARSQQDNASEQNEESTNGVFVTRNISRLSSHSTHDSDPENLNSNLKIYKHNITDDSMNELCLNLDETLSGAEDKPSLCLQKGTIQERTKSSRVSPKNSVSKLKADSNQVQMPPIAKERVVLPQMQSTVKKSSSLYHQTVLRTHSKRQNNNSNLVNQNCSEFDSTCKVRNKTSTSIIPECSATDSSINGNLKYHKQLDRERDIKRKNAKELDKRLELQNSRYNKYERVSRSEPPSPKVRCITDNKSISKKQMLTEDLHRIHNSGVNRSSTPPLFRCSERSCEKTEGLQGVQGHSEIFSHKEIRQRTGNENYLPQRNFNSAKAADHRISSEIFKNNSSNYFQSASYSGTNLQMTNDSEYRRKITCFVTRTEENFRNSKQHTPSLSGFDSRKKRAKECFENYSENQVLSGRMNFKVKDVNGEHLNPSGLFNATGSRKSEGKNSLSLNTENRAECSKNIQYMSMCRNSTESNQNQNSVNILNPVLRRNVSNISNTSNLLETRASVAGFLEECVFPTEGKLGPLLSIANSNKLFEVNSRSHKTNDPNTSTSPECRRIHFKVSKSQVRSRPMLGPSRKDLNSDCFNHFIN